jgi:CBS-domain-containing membrane protein
MREGHANPSARRIVCAAAWREACVVPAMSPVTVAQIMNRKVAYIREGDRLSFARLQIQRLGVPTVPVLDEHHRPVGVVSLRDLAGDDRRVVASIPVKSIPGEATLEQAARALLEADVPELVVVDLRGIAIGVVSAIALVRALSAPLAAAFAT